MSENNKTNKQATDEPRPKKTDLRRNQLIMRQVFHMCEVNQGLFLFFCEFCEISKYTFFTEHPRATASVKIEMQVKIMTSN